MQFVILGNPINRRVQMFQEALHAMKLPRALEVSWSSPAWRDELQQHASGATALRIDSPEGDLDFLRQTLHWGADEMAHETGEVTPPAKIQSLSLQELGLRSPRQRYLGFCRHLRELEPLCAQFRCTHPPENVAIMSDKSACWARFQEAQLPIPQALLVRDPKALFEAMDAHDMPRVFIKFRHGSSASGICAYRRDGHKEHLFTSIASSRYGLANSLRLRHYTDPDEIQHLLDWLFAEGAHVEQWLPKMRIEEREFDFRIVSIDSRACHVVPRVARHGNPMTNLHFGNERGDLAAIVQIIGPTRWQQSLELAERAATLFPTHHCIGVDIMLCPQRGPILLEVNAFGDLLPGITWHGMSTYEAQIYALMHDIHALPEGGQFA